MVILVATVVAMSAVAQLWEDEWEVLLIALQVSRGPPRAPQTRRRLWVSSFALVELLPAVLGRPSGGGTSSHVQILRPAL